MSSSQVSPDLAARLDQIIDSYLRNYKDLLQQRAEIDVLMSALTQIAPFLKDSMDTALKSRQKIADATYDDLVRQISELRLGKPIESQKKPN